MTRDYRAIAKSAALPERTVAICLRGDLQADYEQAERDLEEAQRTPSDSLAGSGAGQILQRMDDLRQQMLEHTYPFRLRALPRPAYRELALAHPPREVDGQPHELDAKVGVNTDTFLTALVRACLVDPVLDDEEWSDLYDTKLTDWQATELQDAAHSLCRRKVDVPFSLAASTMTRTSDDG